MAADRICDTCRKTILARYNKATTCLPCQHDAAQADDATPIATGPTRSAATLRARQEQIVRLLKNGPLSRRALMEATGVSRATIDTDVRAMVGAEVIEECGTEEGGALYRLAVPDYEELMGAA